MIETPKVFTMDSNPGKTSLMLSDLLSLLYPVKITPRFIVIAGIILGCVGAEKTAQAGRTQSLQSSDGLLQQGTAQRDGDGWVDEKLPDGSHLTYNATERVRWKAYDDRIRVLRVMTQFPNSFDQSYCALEIPGERRTTLEMVTLRKDQLDLVFPRVRLFQKNSDGTEYEALERVRRGEVIFLGKIRSPGCADRITEFKLVPFRDGIVSFLEPKGSTQ